MSREASLALQADQGWRWRSDTTRTGSRSFAPRTFALLSFQRAEQIVSAFDVLAGNPLIGRPVHGDSRELVMGRGSRGDVALYRYVDVTDTVIVLAIRAQRAAGYARDA
ncbi:hypothetical protein [Xanthomonas translucens]|uniref:hypothetical protein n=1 Tax=Xanthomonas campestris pv. translucens TaxID=343 RepID=UPI001E2D9D0F|nr:hypothetical protein [Xanthomonas translucens]